MRSLNHHEMGTPKPHGFGVPNSRVVPQIDPMGGLLILKEKQRLSLFVVLWFLGKQA